MDGLQITAASSSLVDLVGAPTSEVLLRHETEHRESSEFSQEAPETKPTECKACSSELQEFALV